MLFHNIHPKAFVTSLSKLNTGAPNVFAGGQVARDAMAHQTAVYLLEALWQYRRQLIAER
jgi:hypothetical protein